MWPTSSRGAALGYGMPTPEMGMFVVAPATSFHHHLGAGGTVQHHHEGYMTSTDPHHGGGGSGCSLNNAATALGMGVGVGVIPLLTAGPCLAGGGSAIAAADDDLMSSRNRAAIQLAAWQNMSPYTQKKIINFDSGGPILMPSSSGMSSGGGSATCQDCGNQAKKDCSHRRCRTCCRSRGFDCSTHVKSTWVPAARRRERQMVTTAVTATGGGGGGGASSGSTSGAKKPRIISSQTTSPTSTSNTPPRSFETNSSHQDASFKQTLPGQVKAPAIFKCVRVTAMEDGEDDFAYQAVVKIEGHVFKGFLYDQGVEPREEFLNMSELHLGATSSGDRGGGRNVGSFTSPLLDPTHVFRGGSGCDGGGGGLLGGSNYGNTID